MTFSQLSIGDFFEFAQKSNVGCGLFNGIGRKISKDKYKMVNLHVIGDKEVKVIKKISLDPAQ